MNLIEKKMNLFDVDDKYYFAHCISADVGTDNRAMGMGIVIEFNKRFNMKSKLQKLAKGQNYDYPQAILIDKVFNLITKAKYYGKPTYGTLNNALVDMRDTCIQENIKYLAICKLGCGLDKLKWDIVKINIEEIFKDTDIEILVCSL